MQKLVILPSALANSQESNVPHTYLLEAGRWSFKGHWVEDNKPALEISGRTLVNWNQDDWFTVATKIEFHQQHYPELVLQYRGRLSIKEDKYTYVLQHSQLGRVEGEGWVTPTTIVQRYWVLGAQRSGLESWHRHDDNCYYFTSSIVAGQRLVSILTATLQRVIA